MPPPAHRIPRHAGPAATLARAAFVLLLVLCATPAANATGSLAASVQRLLAAGGVPRAAGGGDASAALAAFYERRGYRPYWIDGDRPGEAAQALFAGLRAAAADGIAVDTAIFAGPGTAATETDAAGLAELELRLSAAYREFGWRLANGSAALRRADPRWHIQAPPLEPLALLDAAPSTQAVRGALDALRPPHAQYAALRAALQRYRALADAGGWPAIGSGPTLEPGMTHADVAVLRERLRLSGDLQAAVAAPGHEFDAALERAVLGFQQRHGLEPDGRVGRSTRAALNVPVTERVDQIARSLERWRWMPRALGDRYVFVNVPSFDLQAVDAGRVVAGMRVIVGRPSRATPSFTGMLERVIVNPSWYVPSRIARADLLPKQRRDPRYFASQSIRVFADAGYARELDPASIDWSGVSAQSFPYFLRQDPGPGNSLGRIKLMVDNPFDIYLHDTPARSLFEQRVRAFSSGCIRLEDAPALAAFLMDDAREWTPARLRALVDEGATVTLRPPRPVPVYVTYFTVRAEPDGAVHFHPDLYGRDARVGSCG